MRGHAATLAGPGVHEGERGLHGKRAARRPGAPGRRDRELIAAAELVDVHVGERRDSVHRLDRDRRHGHPGRMRSQCEGHGCARTGERVAERVLNRHPQSDRCPAVDGRWRLGHKGEVRRRLHDRERRAGPGHVSGRLGEQGVASSQLVDAHVAERRNALDDQSGRGSGEGRARCGTRAEREPHGASWDEVARLVCHGDLDGGKDRRVRPGPCRWLGREGKARWTTAGDLGRPRGPLIGGRIVGQPRLGRSVGVHDIDLVVSVSKTHERDLLAVWGPTWLEFN